MTQLADYRASVERKGYDGLTDDLLDGAIQAARRRVMKERRWRFLESVSTTLVTVALDAEVSLAPVTDLVYVDAVRPVASGEERELDFRSYQELRHLQAKSPANGLPRFWTRHNSALLLWPTPDIAYTLNVDYVAKLADLADAVDDVIPEELQDLVVWAAVPDLAFRQREGATMQAAEGQYRELLRQANAQENVQQRQSSRQVRSGYWGTRDIR